MMKFILITFLVFWTGVILPAQQPAYFTIGEDELKDHHVYTIHQGKDGIIYAGTDYGLFAYKHGAFEKVEVTPEQVGSAFFDLKRDNNGDLYCMNFSGQIFQLVDNKLELFFQTPREHLTYHFNFLFDGNNDIVVASNNLFKISRKTKQIEIYGLSLLSNIQFFQQISKNHFIFSSNHISYELKDNRIFRVDFFDQKGNRIIHEKLHPFISIDTNHSSIRKDTINNISVTRYIIDDSIDRNGYKHNFEKNHQFNNNEFFEIDRKKGVHLYEKENNSIRKKEFWFPHQFISTLTQTQDGKILCGTFGRGIHVIPNRNITKGNIIPYNEKCNGLSTRKELLYFTTDAKKIYSFDGEITRLERQETDNHVTEKIFHIDDFIYSKKNGLNHFLYGNKNVRGTIKDVWELPHGNILIAHAKGLTFFNHEKMNHPKWSGENNSNFYLFKVLRGRTTAVCYAPSSKTIYTSHKGQLLAIDSTYDRITNITYQDQDIHSSDLFFKDETLYIASQKHGILTLNNGMVSEKYNTKNGLEHNYIKKIKIINNQLFLSHLHGLQIINLDNDEIKTIGVAEGVSKGKISDFETDGKKLWVLQKNEILSLYLNQLQSSDDKIVLHFDSLTVNNEKIDFKKENIFNYQQRKFNFHLDFRSAILQNETKIIYKLEGEDENWIAPNKKNYNISYQALAPGNYTFRAYAKYRNVKSDEFVYSFEIISPVWERWWFYLLATLIISAIISISLYFFYKNRMNQLNQLNQAALEKEKAEREKQKAEKEMVESELKALRSQMNPHFIFNSLNSIQDLILREETDKSYDYIVLFADLVRSTLNHSNKKFIQAKKELDFLNTYLSLEKLRFKEDFNYSIQYTGSKDIKVPSLVVQPFIENALLHGLLHKKGLKTLSIHFEVFEDVIHCSIVDNGIGRQRAREIRERQRANHQSFSMDAIKKRLAFLSEQHEVDAGYEFIDLQEGETATGTKVLVKMPYKHLF